MTKRKCDVLRIDVFTETPEKGNPAGLVLNGDDFTDKEMQQIAKEANFNETVFVCSSQIADLRLRFFMPLKETELCGHGTIGAIYQLYQGKASQEITVETLAGILEVSYDKSKNEVTMKQNHAIFKDFSSDKLELCQLLTIEIDDLSDELPVIYGNTGVWTLLVPVKNEAILDKMIPRTKEFPNVLKEFPNASIHPIVILSEIEASARHFSGFGSGSIEDSVTGTASGVMGAYLLKYLFNEKNQLELLVHQGKHLNQEGVVKVRASKNELKTYEVKISGKACLNGKLTITI
ncbi:PhzF family phenazine biosynthesis protein [Vagococcus fluvialis]|uniref:Phenazine biosynthesis protein PhzF n=1 Tax=Vagococcus fluvialis TaxID=2738 RepID=A0A369B2I4_9ENTE|nr:PhzF family phenazine biosynthesis isomerase [Vagococcus fluvialis]MBO0442671.1 PhzF family phenazine biosynthesis isomerase [Vagococcus fluvialis]MCM2139346.1 PhzF family phenazine biosynthesis isomerase [Vagococcus fluvialis]MDT2747574.1 PhzF family phenazine biosynthesis isomerase [Vagococcus fluvialis]NKC59298.1 PhzF family phenazine biosynthesis isomerase [Vagococcus fluvialis]NKD50306.1 PhzF family phenazine biosynthesis isomerase [Vagococcus fluvialis]